MGILIVRKPSDTPNIKNVDDFVGLRYAYGNQNGYILGKGRELSYSIEGSVFRINSGRIVIQGVEVDIDVNGVPVSIDNINGIGYFKVFCRVNLATNNATIECVYNSNGYDGINLGASDDLTVNASGSAYVELYRFMSVSGVIDEDSIDKTIDSVKYLKDVLVENAVNAKFSETKNIEDNSKNIATTAFVTLKLAKELEGKMNKWVVLYNNNSNASTTINVTNLTNYGLLKIYYKIDYYGNKSLAENRIRDGGEFLLSAFDCSQGVMLNNDTGYACDHYITRMENNLISHRFESDTLSGTLYITQVLGMKL